MNPFVLDAKARLSAWKSLRNQIQQTQQLADKVNITLDFWKQAPIENPIIDCDNSKNWPGPWELLHTNRFCESSLSLAVGYTLVLSDPSIFADTKLMFVTDRAQHIQKITVSINGWIINHGWLDCQSISDLKNLHTHQVWTFNGKSWTEKTRI